MKRHCLFVQSFPLYPAALAVLLLATAGMTEPAWAEQGVTQWQGGGAGSPKSIRCPIAERLVGVRVRSGTVIDEMSVFCMVPDSHGNWSSAAPTVRGAAQTNNPQPAHRWEDRTCRTDQYVHGFRVYSRWHGGRLVIARIQLDCRAASASLTPVGSASRRSAGATATGGQWSNWTRCQNMWPLAYGVGVRKGWYVDAMRLLCHPPRP